MRQAARSAASGVRGAQRGDREERESRLERLAVEVITAVGERDAAVAATEARAGDALRRIVEVEGLSVTEAVKWCAGVLSVRDVGRLRRLADPQSDSSAIGTPAEPAGSNPVRVGGS